MTRQRLLIAGIVILLLGVQFRRVDTYTFNEPASNFIQQRLAKVNTDTTTSYTSDDIYSNFSTSGSLKTFSPPRWMGLKFISIGAVMILICPCFRN